MILNDRVLSIDRATSQLTNDANRISQSLLQCVQIVLKDIVLQIYKPDSASNLGHACIFYLACDDQNRSMLLQVHALAANSGPPIRSYLAMPTSGTPPNHF